MPRFQLKALLRTIHRKRPTAMPVVPTILTAINGYDRLSRYDLSSLRFCISGGAPLPLEIKQQFEARSGSKVVEGYGLSESSPVLCCNPIDGRDRPGSVGLPYPGTTIEIVGLDPPERLLPIGETGEICGRGPQVMAGYWKRPEETAAALRHGRLHTGDVGHLDAEGFLYISDRIKEMINAGGFKIYPRMVEEALYSHPDVAECAVIGVGDPYRGQTVKAVIVLQPGRRLTGEDLTRHLAGRLSPIELPKLYEFRTSLPKTAIGKIDKKVLVAEHAAASGPDQESSAR
jgi:long-chain acyl-CoA synthetase